jgi:hypothetical protein
MDLIVDSDGEGDGEDRLSALPDELLIHILDIVDDDTTAAWISILASGWRCLWALLLELRFFLIENHRIGAALAAHEVPNLNILGVVTEDALIRLKRIHNF